MYNKKEQEKEKKKEKGYLIVIFSTLDCNSLSPAIHIHPHNYTLYSSLAQLTQSIYTYSRPLSLHNGQQKTPPRIPGPLQHRDLSSPNSPTNRRAQNISPSYRLHLHKTES